MARLLGALVAGAVAGAVVTAAFSIPQSYNRPNYQYGGGYDRRGVFMAPIGVDPRTAQLFQQGS